MPTRALAVAGALRFDALGVGLFLNVR
jgi:hypothetical protein